MSFNSGNLYGTVVDQQGQLLPGATLTLTGPGGPQITVSNAQGQFRFPDLQPGSYDVKAELEGFGSSNHPGIGVYVGDNINIDITLSPGISE
jgi:hypothetical protein